MPIHIYWYIPEHVVYVEMTGDIDEALFKRFVANPFGDREPPTRYHSITDARRAKSMPTMKVMTKADMLPALDWVFFVTDRSNPLGQFIASVAMQVLRVRFRFIDKPEDAHTILRHVDPALRDVTFPTDTTGLPLIRVMDSQTEDTPTS